MKHWLYQSDCELAELAELVQIARDLKAGRDAVGVRQALRGRVMGMVFFNPSLRTRVSFESGMFRFGGHAICLNVGTDAWRLEHRDGAVMNDVCAEHVREAAPVLSRYCDVLGVRTFAALNSATEDADDAVLRAFARHATVPVVNMESAMAHPCQGLADRITMEEKLGGARGRRFVLTWAPHVKALPMAVPHSAILAAASAGMQVTLAHPPGYELHAGPIAAARRWCRAQGAELTVTAEQMDACRAADVVYVKSWGSADLYGHAEAQAADFARYDRWRVSAAHLGSRDAILMHCLPVRRNVVIADDALDDPRCAVVDQAENRMWAQMAIVGRIVNNE